MLFRSRIRLPVFGGTTCSRVKTQGRLESERASAGPRAVRLTAWGLSYCLGLHSPLFAEVNWRRERHNASSSELTSIRRTRAEVSLPPPLNSRYYVSHSGAMVPKRSLDALEAHDSPGASSSYDDRSAFNSPAAAAYDSDDEEAWDEVDVTLDQRASKLAANKATADRKSVV